MWYVHMQGQHRSGTLAATGVLVACRVYIVDVTTR